MHDICSDELEITGQSGYIKTPHYPNNYPRDRDCSVTIRAPHSSQNVRLYIIDLRLTQQRTGCSDWLQMRDGHRSKTLCGARSRVDGFVSLGNAVTVKFHSSSQQQNKGFWLMYTGNSSPTATSVCMFYTLSLNLTPTLCTSNHRCKCETNRTN